ncbi:MAG: hypothetical protein PHE70_07690 [Tepidanaerobacteraceae bacterium]|jgi:hypothetical protein|nr:hypothetical protein [Tepidanaerobacteraceae bacterium]
MGDKIKELSLAFAQYKIYPLSKFIDDSPLRKFQELYPSNHYSIEIESFLTNHNYSPIRRGADLPWWGKKYFSSEPGFRVMIITRDSLSEDAGSVVLYSHLFPVIRSQSEYYSFTNSLNKKQSFSFNSWNTFRSQFNQWSINLDYLYVTDAAMVYKIDNNTFFDKDKSRRLLKQEIEICNPDLIIMLGSSSFDLLTKGLKFGEVAESGRAISVQGIKCVVCPFISGQGVTQKRFKEKLAKATEAINGIVNKQKYTAAELPK